MKWFPAALVAVALLGSGSVAYACGGGGGGGCNSGWFGPNNGCPSLEIEWKNPSGVTPGPYVQCVLTLTPQQLDVVVGGLSPGTGCKFYANLTNTGTEDVYLSESVTINSPATCRLFTYSDNVPASPEHEVRSGQSYNFKGSVVLAATAGSACERATATFQVTITGSTSSGPCGNYPLLTYVLQGPQKTAP